MYLDDVKKFDKSLIEVWVNEVKPYVLKKYPVSIKGVFNENYDLECLIELIDKYNVISIEEVKKKDTNNINKSNIMDDKRDKQEKISKIQNDIKEFIKNNKNKNVETKLHGSQSQGKKNVKKKLTNNKQANIEEDIKILRKENMAKISKFLEDYIKQNEFQKRKRTNSMINLRPHSQTIASATTCDDSICIEDTNLNINKLIENNKKNEINEKEKKIKDNIDDYFKINDIKEKINKKEEKRKISMSDKTIFLLREMIPKYIEEEEYNDINIKYLKPSNELSFISIDLLLRKIIFEDFIKNNILLIYHFCQQCYCFIPKENFFKKLLDCYHYYKKAKISLNQLKNLIEFLNILVVALFEYYEKINYKEVYVKVIKTFYYELINDIIIDYNESENNMIINDEYKDNNINDIKDIKDINEADNEFNDNNNEINNIIDDENNINRANLIEKNLNFEKDNTVISLLKKREEENSKINIEGASFSYNDNDYDSDNENEKSLVLEDNLEEKKQNNNNKRLPKRNTVSLNENTSNKSPKAKKEKEKEKDSEKNLALNKENTKQDNNTQMQFSNTFKIPNTIFIKDITENMINDEIIKEEKSEDEDEKSFEKCITVFSLKKGNLLDKTQQKQKEEENIIIDNLAEEIFTNNKIISPRDEMLQIIRCILCLIDVKNGKGLPSISDIRNAKKNLSFYKLVDESKKQSATNLLIEKRKRITKTKSVSHLTYMSSRPQINKREYLNKGYFCVADWKTSEIGDKITEVTESLLIKIHPRELYRGIFTKDEKEKTSPNVCFCIKSSNRLSSFIIEDILSFVNLKERTKIFEKWVQVADYLKTKKNYNDCLAIFLALNKGYFIPVKKELRIKTKKQLEQIAEFCSCLGNFKNIKEDIKQCEKNGEIFIPYLGLLLKDILNFNENPKYSNYICETGCINMEKIEKTNTIIEKYFKFKTGFTQNTQNIKELDFFYHLKDISEDDLDKIEEKKGDILDNKKLTYIDRKYFHQYYIDFKKRQSLASNTGIMMYNGQYFIPSSFY